MSLVNNNTKFCPLNVHSMNKGHCILNVLLLHDSYFFRNWSSVLYTVESPDEILVTMICSPPLHVKTCRVVDVANQGHEDGILLSLPQCNDSLFFSHAFIFDELANF